MPLSPISAVAAPFNGGTITNPLIIAANGAASTPALKLNGTWFTGGTGTTTKPLMLIEPSADTSTAWNTSGTGLGINAPSGFGGNLIDCQINAALLFRVMSSGRLRVSKFGGGLDIYDDDDSTLRTSIVAGIGNTVARWQVGNGVCIGDDEANPSGLRMQSAGLARWSSDTTWFGTSDLGLARASAGLVEVNNGTAGTLRDIKCRDVYTNDATFLIRTNTSLTDSAAAQAATILNGPVAGNPSKWFAIDDNGTTRFIPAWS